jgi:hypothetical protein
MQGLLRECAYIEQVKQHPEKKAKDATEYMITPNHNYL